MNRSRSLHFPWGSPPLTSEDFHRYINRNEQPNNVSLLLLDDASNIVGVFNINEIVRGIFQCAYLGFYPQ